MKTEKIILSFIAVLFGLLAAGVAFYFYQSIKVVQVPQDKTTAQASPTPSPLPAVYVTITTPEDEDVVEKKTVTISGKTVPEAIVVVSTGIGDDILTPAANGNFTGTITLENGVNQIIATAITPNGQSATITKTLTFSTESF